MKITETHDIGNDYDEYYGKGSIDITLEFADGITASLGIMAGEPEDAVFFRDLDGAYNISKLIKLAYEAGKRGEEMTYVFVDESEDNE